MGALNFFFITIGIPFALTGKKAVTYLHGRDKRKERPETDYSQFEMPRIIFQENSGVFDIQFGEHKYLTSCQPRIEHDGKVYAAIPGKKITQLNIIDKQEGIETVTPMGATTETRITWKIPGTEKQIICAILVGKDKPFINFKLSLDWDHEITKPGKFKEPKIVFPHFKNESANENVLTWENGKFAPPRMHFEFAAAPVVLYDNKLNTFVFSSLDHFFITGVLGEKHSKMGCGIAGSVERVPSDFVFQSILYFGKGINNSMEQWGALFRKYHETSEGGGKIKDPYGNPITAYLGYNTDNGAYYYYRTAWRKNYEDTMIALRQHHKEIGLPFGYYELDSWWYPKTFEKLPGFLKIFLFGSALHWGEPPKESVFPHGLKYVWDQLDNLPLMCHSRWFSPKSHYVEEYDFVVDGKLFAAPKHQDFWDDLFEKSKEWGLSCYLQDWLSYQYNSIDVMKSTVDFAENWTTHMAAGAARQGMTLQYCMAPASFMMQTVKLPNVTQARASDDHSGVWPRRWYVPHFTVTSILCKAIGLWPHKDVFYSSSGPKHDFFYKERRPELECLVANLSGGPVSPGDKIGHEDVELLMKTCRSDGLLLKPDAPATPVDLMFMEHAKYYITLASNEKPSGMTWHYVSIMNMWPRRVRDKTVTLEDLQLEGKHAAFTFSTREFTILERIDQAMEFNLGRARHELVILCEELLDGVYLLGNYEKFVTCSNKQVPDVRVNKEQEMIEVDLINLPDEPVPLMLYSTKKPREITNGEMSYDEGSKKLIVNGHVGGDGKGKVVIAF